MGEFVSAMQKFYLEKYEDLFYCIIHLGGCLPQAQLCRLLFKNETKNSVSQRLFRDFKKAKLIRVAKMSRGNLIMLAYPTFLHCGLDRTAYYNGKRVKLGSLIMEKHLSRGIYDEPDPASALRKKLESSSYQYRSEERRVGKECRL